MNGCILETNLEGQGWYYVFHFVVSNLGAEIFLKKRQYQKRVHKMEDWGTSVHFVLGFQEIPFTLYTFVLAKILQNGVKFIQKLTPRFKNHMRNLGNFREAAGNQKSWNSMGYFCAKNTFFQLKHYILRIYLTLLSATCVKIHQILYWNHKSFFTTQLLCIFLAHIIILHNITSHNITYFLQKWFIKVQVSRLSTARIKTHQIPHVIFETKSQFFLKICITFQCRET